MKNLMTTITLFAVLMVGTIAANANTGVLLADRGACNTKTDSTLEAIGGIILGGLAGGIILGGREGGIILGGRDGGIILGGKTAATCQQQDSGILVGD